jgi:hypothetical protein
MQRRFVFVIACIGLAVLAVSCASRRERLARARSKEFYKVFLAGKIGTAAQYILDEDYPAFFESWRPGRDRLKGVEDYDVEVKLNDSETAGVAICKGKTKAGEVTVTYGLRRSAGDWWIRVHEPASKAEEPPEPKPPEEGKSG